VIESLAKINTIVFDKTGTITQSHTAAVNYEGLPLSDHEKAIIRTISKQSSHPLSKVIYNSIPESPERLISLKEFQEFTGKGLQAIADNTYVKMGSSFFVKDNIPLVTQDTGTAVHVLMDNVHMGTYRVQNQYRQGLSKMIKSLDGKGFDLYVLSGDNDLEKDNLVKIFGRNANINFQQSPQQKLDYIKYLQKSNKHVLMLGDGLNDAGALMQSHVGTAVSENSAQFSPASDAILDGSKVSMLDKFISFARSGKTIVMASFILSILYNIVGLSFAVQGLLSPMVAAILMPTSSISIVLFVSLYSSFIARKKGL